MKVKFEKPPIWQDVIDAGMHPNEHTTIFAYGDTIYSPGGKFPTDDLLVHEETHSKQQGDDPDEWWGRYLTDQYFRIDQEVEAYANQYRFLCEKIKDRNRRSMILLEMGIILASPQYGSVIDYQSAYKMIKDKANVNF